MLQGPWHQHAAAAEERGSSGDIHLEPEVGEEGWTGLPVFQPVLLDVPAVMVHVVSSWGCVIPPTVMGAACASWKRSATRPWAPAGC